jgi:O-antigen biosynthesis protein
VNPIAEPLDHPIAFTLPRRLSEVRNWQEHIPFGMYLVSVLRPRLVVELGTHRGDSYCSLCQAVAELRLPATAFAVDTWRGDAHAGAYGPDVLADLRAHHDPLYGSFSELVQTTFDEALDRFQDGSIDLLHIDGYHEYDAVRHDFESWRPKLSDRAVVLLHDTARRVDDFGVWRLADDLGTEFPVFEFLHSHGLTAVFVGADVPPTLRALAELPSEDAAAFRALFAALGAGVRHAGEVQAAAAQSAHTEEEKARFEAMLSARDERLEARLARVEELTDALVQSRVLRVARSVRGLAGRAKT